MGSSVGMEQEVVTGAGPGASSVSYGHNFLVQQYFVLFQGLIFHK